MYFDVLGPLRVIGPGGPVAVPGARARTTLSWLIANPNEPVSWDSLARAVWERPPAEAIRGMRIVVRSIAILLPPETLIADTTVRLRAADGSIDAARFEQLIHAGRAHLRTGALERARANAEAALELWRAEPYPDLARSIIATAEIERLRELRADAIEARQSVLLAGPVDFTVVADLRFHVVIYPHRRALRHQLAHGLYRNGRQIEALDILRQTCADLGDDRGTRELMTAILRHDSTLDPTAA